MVENLGQISKEAVKIAVAAGAAFLSIHGLNKMHRNRWSIEVATNIGKGLMGAGTELVKVGARLNEEASIASQELSAQQSREVRRALQRDITGLNSRQLEQKRRLLVNPLDELEPK